MRHFRKDLKTATRLGAVNLFGLRFCVLCLRVVVYRFKGGAGFSSLGRVPRLSSP